MQKKKQNSLDRNYQRVDRNIVKVKKYKKKQWKV